ncbi:hypothetical protein Hanom_Chr06g00491091 [Helianthus anomalus]
MSVDRFIIHGFLFAAASDEEEEEEGESWMSVWALCVLIVWALVFISWVHYRFGLSIGPGFLKRVH